MKKSSLRFLLLVVMVITASLLAALPVPAQDDAPASIRVAHFAADAGSMDIYFDGERIGEEIGAPGYVRFFDTAAGTHTLTVVPAGSSMDAAAIPPIEIMAEAGHRYTVAIIGQAADDSLSAEVFDETALIADVDMSQNVFRILINNLPGVPALSFYEADMWIEQNIPYGGFVAKGSTPFVWNTGKAVVGEDLDNIVFDFDSDAEDNAAGFWEPYTVYFYGTYGTYPGAMFEDYGIDGPGHYVVAPDLATFLSAFTPFDLTGDFDTYYKFETFVSAMEASDFAAALPDEPLTIFVPVDQAFEALPAGTLDTLMADPAALRELLLNHVVRGSMTYDEMLEAGTLTTLSGGTLTVHESEDDGYHFVLDSGSTWNGVDEVSAAMTFEYPFIDWNNTRVYFVKGVPFAP